MNMDSSKMMVSLIAVLSGLVVISAITFFEMRSTHKELRGEWVTLTLQAKEIDTLKKRWSIKESEDELNYFMHHPNLIKQERQGESIRLEFGDLSTIEFNRLTNRLLNSTMVIKSLSLRRTEAAKGIITVEIES